MCCFSRPVEHVSQTKIFARTAGKDRQFIVYSMTIDAKEDLAMILPIPVPDRSPDDAVKFINLEKYPEFFADLKKGFPDPPPSRASHSFSLGVPMAAAKKLDVVSVGSFEASFVPTIADFSRLDERFRLPNEAWNELPQYKGFGFAVFKLKQGKKTIHPMAFDFPTAVANRLFFPTVHIHDGKVHDKADFDHALYCQAGESDDRKALLHWRESERPADAFMDVKRSKGLIDPEAHAYLTTIRGMKKNQDTLV
jgi:hypothetical protein